MSSVPVYCICGKPYEASKFMIQCDACKEWFHGSCVGLKEHLSMDIDKYHCPKCEKMFGPSIVKRRMNWHRHDYTEANADNKGVQTGTPVFITELVSRHFPSADDIIIRLRGQHLTLPYLMQNGFSGPILVEQTDGLGLTVPHPFTVSDVGSYLDSDMEIDVIDVGRQEDIKMTFQEFAEYFGSPVRTKTLNVISLECSNTRLSRLVEAPHIVRKLSWTHNCWPESLPEGCHLSKPEVQKYCLMGMKDSYTDFHIDFGGTSVWYHVLRGEKIFYLIRPTPANLALYERWMSSSNQSETFFGDQVDVCHECTVQQGQTMFIPTGWIHAVLTPVDSMVFGGNFLHNLNIPLQLQVYEIEKRVKTPEKFKFPSFEACNWFAAKHILDELKECNESGRKPPAYLIQGTKTLLTALKSWLQDKEHQRNHRPEIPEFIQPSKLIKDLGCEVRHAEKPHLAQRARAKAQAAAVAAALQANSIVKRMATTHEVAQENKTSIFPGTTLGVCAPLTVQCDNQLTNESDHLPSYLPKSGHVNTDSKDADSLGLRLLIPRSALTRENGGTPPQLKKQPSVDTEKISAKSTETRRIKMKLGTGVTSEPSIKTDESVYDFRDSDDDNLVVDENPPPRPNIGRGGQGLDATAKQGPFKLKLSFNGKPVPPADAVGSTSQVSQESAEVDVVTSPKLSGIEDLLRASGYGTDSESKFDDDLGSGRASPSTREAIQGMLSIGRAIQFSLATATSGTQAASKQSNATSASCGAGRGTRPQRQRKKVAYSDDFGENISQCHQDEEFIYPTLDVSDDEGPVFKSRGRGKRDEPWNPKTKLVPNCPKPERPMREGVKKEAVESGLAAAAARLADLPPPKRSYHRKKPPQKTQAANVEEEVEDPQPGPSALNPDQCLKRPAPLFRDAALKAKKPKKGMATAKQRLGKILKIHKMLY